MLRNVRQHFQNVRHESHPPATLGDAAVAIVLQANADELEALFIRRAEHPLDPWSGHIAFPGGRAEQADSSLYDTVVRETREETAIDLVSHELLGWLPSLHAVAYGKRLDFRITPYVFLAEDRVEGHPNEEVAQIFWAPLGPFARGESATVLRYDHSGQTLELPAYRVEDRVIWGLTYRMLQSLFSVLPLA